MILVVLIPLVALLFATLILIVLGIGVTRAGNLKHTCTVSISRSPIKHFLVFNDTEIELTEIEARKAIKDGYTVIQK